MEDVGREGGYSSIRYDVYDGILQHAEAASKTAMTSIATQKYIRCKRTSRLVDTKPSTP
jgi:hypothetical protein